ncbi:MAG TPA: hypothetical protein VH988_16135 [Thermoanaerobaculia bacterium]|jgi:hypothetical protein|nr:hypothetical protein [Thermoanaerobaculia bacterium]
MKFAHLLSIVGLFTCAASLAAAGSPADGADFAGTYLASLPTRAEILQLHSDGTAEITLSDEVTSGAGGFTFSDSFGSWKVVGPRKLEARFLNLNFDVTGPAAFSGTAVVGYVWQFAANFKTMAASCQGKIFPPGQDPFSPSSTPVTTFDCSYLNGYLYKKMPL